MSSQNNNRKTQAPRPVRGGGGPGMHGGVPVEKPKNFRKSFRRLVGYLARKRGALISVIVLAAGSAAFAIIGPKLLGNATTEIFNGIMGKMMGGGGIDFDAIKRILIIVVSLYVISGLLDYAQQFIMAGTAQKNSIRHEKRGESKAFKASAKIL